MRRRWRGCGWRGTWSTTLAVMWRPSGWTYWWAGLCFHPCLVMCGSGRWLGFAHVTRVLATKNVKDDKWAGAGQYLHDRYGAHPALLRCRLRGAAHGMDDFGVTVDRRQRTGPLYFVYDSHRESADAWGSLLGHPHEEGAAAVAARWGV
jgi:hypothetical protein